MKNDWTELVFILDRSGSMAGLESDTIGGFNSMIEKQKQSEGSARVSVILFDDISEVIYNRVKLKKVKPMTKEQYEVCGCTALLDAVGGAIRFVQDGQRTMRKKNRPSKTLFVITTDGLENASRNYSYDTVRRMIEGSKEQDGWEFLFLGANMDAVGEAAKFGIPASRAVNYENDAVGMNLNYEVLSQAVSAVRAASDTSQMDAVFQSGEWSAPIRKDYRKRHIR